MGSHKVRTKTSVPERKYKNELRGAWNMITCSPEDPTGYLIAGHCYKDHGKQEKAIKVFNIGLNQVSTKHKEYEALRQGKQEAESRRNCRMDMLGQLPLESIHYIFDNFFDQDSITPCSRVCSTWRNIILDYSKFWKRISFGNWRSKDDVLSPHHMLLPSISQHVQEIEIFNKSQLTTLFELFQTTQFPIMRSLTIEHGYSYNIKRPISYTELSPALNGFSKTLTTLDLQFYDKNTNFPPNLSDILNICNNLTMLRYVLVNPDLPVFLPIKPTAQQNTSLKELILSSACKKDKMNSTELQKLLINAPHLSRLAILNCDDSVYTAVQKHGQSINKLEIVHHNAPYSCRFGIERNNHDNIAFYNTSPGLKYIKVSSIGSPRTLLQLIKNHHHTLSFLSIYFCEDTSSNDNDWRKWTEDLHVFPLTNLTEFRLTDQDQSGSLACNYLLPAVITALNDNNSVINQQTPNLQSLVLDGLDIIPDSVLDAIIKMPKFTELVLFACEFNLDKMHDILRIFERRSNNNTILTATTKTDLLQPPPSSLLTKLCLAEASVMSDDIVLTASKIKSLTDLTIDHSEYEDYRVYKTLAQNISELPLLEQVELRYVDMKMDDLKILFTSKSLRDVELYCLRDYFHSKQIYQLAKNLSNNKLRINHVVL